MMRVIPDALRVLNESVLFQHGSKTKEDLLFRAVELGSGRHLNH